MTNTDTIKPIVSNSTKGLFYHLLAIIVCLPLPLASNRPWAWSIMEAWIFALFGIWLLLVFRHKIAVPDHLKKCWLPLLALISFAGLTVVQLLPVGGAETNTIAVLNDLQWNTLSFDPHATTEHLLKTLAYICLFILTIALVNTEQRIKAVFYAFFFSGLFQAAYGSLMTLTKLEYIFFMKKEAYIGRATGTFINRNHFANYLAMCAAAGTALLLIDISQQRKKTLKEMLVGLLHFIMSKKMLLRICLALIVVGIVLSRSRMGNTAFFVSLIIAGVIWMICTKRFGKNAIILLASLIIIDLWVVGNWFGFEEVKARIQSTSSSIETRDEVVRDTLAYMKLRPLTGTGGGSYYSVYPTYKSPDVNGYYTHTHNDYLQIISEYGFIGLGLIALFVITSGITALRTLIKRRNPIMQSVGFMSIMVILALLMHSIVDFNLQMMANAASAVIIMALAWVARYLPTQQTRRG